MAAEFMSSDIMESPKGIMESPIAKTTLGGRACDDNCNVASTIAINPQVISQIYVWKLLVIRNVEISTLKNVLLVQPIDL